MSLLVPERPRSQIWRVLGVARVSVGSVPMRATVALTRRIAQELLEQGTYTTWTENTLSYAELKQLLLLTFLHIAHPSLYTIRDAHPSQSAPGIGKTASEDAEYLSRVGRAQHLDARNPLDPFKTAPTLGDQAQGKTMLVRERLRSDMGRQ